MMTSQTQVAAKPTIRAVSADSHIVEPGNCYIDHIETKYRDIAPHIERVDRNGKLTDVFVIDGLDEQLPVVGVASAGRDPATFTSGFVEDAHAGGWDPHIRVKDQDRDGIAAEILYPSIGMVLCAHPDAAYKQSCMWAYNRWLEEFTDQYPDRLFGLGQTAVRSVKEAISDMVRMKAMGFRGVMLPGFPETEEDYDHESFDPLWEASIDLGMPICFHILTTVSKKDATGSFLSAPKQRGTSRLNAFHATIRGVQDLLSMFIFDGIFDRHPQLRVVCTEADAGWVPHFLHRADHTYKRFASTFKTRQLAKLPSEFFLENIYVTFQDDLVAFKLTHMMNPRRLMWANDFPHPDSTWPHSQSLLSEHAAHLSEEDRRHILRDNAIDLYKLPVPA